MTFEVQKGDKQRLATASHFADQLDTLRKKLSEPPEALFEAPRRRRLVNQI